MIPHKDNFTENVTTFILNSSATPPSCLLAMSCRHFHVIISGAIFAGGIVALLENLMLVVAMVKWDVKKTCKMFWFLWHLAIADAMVGASFLYYHLRIVSSCPLQFSCNSSFMVESLAILVCFFGTIVASHLFILAATVERFIAIQWSLRYSSLVTTKGTTLTAACIWIISFVIPIISAIGITQLHSPTVYTIATLIISSACLLCAFAVILLNLWIVSTAWKSARTVTNRRRRISLPSRNSTMNELVINQDHLKIAVTLSLFVCSFVLSCAPWSVALIICSESTRCVLKREHDYTLVLVLFHAIVIPILYGFRVEEVKLHVLKFWKNLIRKNR